MAKKLKKSGNGRAKPLVAKPTITKSQTRRYKCGGKLSKRVKK